MRYTNLRFTYLPTYSGSALDTGLMVQGKGGEAEREG